MRTFHPVGSAYFAIFHNNRMYRGDVCVLDKGIERTTKKFMSIARSNNQRVVEHRPSALTYFITVTTNSVSIPISGVLKPGGESYPSSCDSPRLLFAHGA